jgi:predicted RNase H-like HicB family nuclease
MNKKAIKNTAVTRWSVEDDCFIVSSPLIDSVIGVGDSESEALKEFCDILDDAYEAYLEGELKYDYPGRPAKNRIALNVDVQPNTKKSIKDLAAEKGCSQGEVVDFLLSYHLLSGKSNSANPDIEFLVKDSGTLKYGSRKVPISLEQRLESVEKKIDRVLKNTESFKSNKSK